MFKKIKMVMLMMLVMGMTLLMSSAGCDNAADSGSGSSGPAIDQALVGKWKLTSSLPAASSFPGGDWIPNEITLNANGTISPLTVYLKTNNNWDSGNTSVSGTWTAGNGVLTLTPDATYNRSPISLPYSISGNTFSGTVQGSTLTYTKQ